MIDLATASDQDILARTLWGEARGERTDGMESVACVIMNRANKATLYFALHGAPHPLFGNGTPRSACLAAWQFSCWNLNDPNRAIIEKLDDADGILQKSLTIAAAVMSGSTPDKTQGATHYYDRRLPIAPKWATGKTPCFTLGHHLFFNNIT